MTTVLLADPLLTAAAESRSQGEPGWLRDARMKSLARYHAEEMPSRVEHLWRYTDPAKLVPGERPVLTPDRSFGDLPADFMDGTFDRASAYAVARDGVLLRAAVDPLLADLGFIVEDVRTAAATRRGLVEPRLFALGAVCGGLSGKFDALSGALFAGGAFVHVPRGVELERPVRIAHRIGGDGVLAARSLLIAEQGSTSTVVFDLTSAGTSASDDAAATVLHETIEIHVGRAATLRVVFVQNLGRKAVHAPVIRSRIERDGRLETVNVALGGGLVKSVQSAELSEPGATTQVLGIVFADGRQHFDHHTFQDHAAPHTTSELDYRTVVADRARSSYTGRLRITEQGTGAAAHQRNHNLVLADTARADTIPELEILTNDVQCSHAAAVGPIDEEQVFYCKSRGLSDAEARRVVVEGFLEPTIAQIPAGLLLDRVRDVLDRRLSGAKA